MIIIECNEEIKISQERYDYIIYNLNIEDLICPNCKKVGYMKYNGSYNRNIKINGEITHLKIQKVLCKGGKSHALIIDEIVKNSIISRKDQKLIIEMYNKNITYEKIAEKLNIETYNVNDIIRRYKIRHRF